ncbi:MAG: disulfide bond formation protein B [Roseitalea sp.]|jgi:disulfide bond formation protein DsbB|uniref:Disulfide bond formation protein B n=1 Tax=Oceaniradius stylonematis TaxID=2184161 RepID=A0A3A8AIW4_9HYPH|nr:disulfide bond formation protein B [Oceaniradius stylonematis]MBO6554476.1 disulfide bond formation protein B [Roseitalea sp.]MBO6953363.1 disulfide bond formation protein B [Rhizobiaceae bacterium]RNC96988.1 MAG: disulfide bond formation protein B [Oricola sp.]MBO6593868.1 disulfide bond formation protein B [Roseitalea sp.]MBO6601107.1 disulfide bond formation protein B [Roseitalea sp.]
MDIASPARSRFFGALALAVAMAIVVGTALAFEHVGGFIPCALCLEQRTPYYAGIPLALFAALAAVLDWPSILTRGALVVAGLLMVYGLYLGVYHAGVEWAFWPGPADCATSATSGLATDAGSLLADLDAVTPPACDDAAGRFLGLSFAGWNVIASLGLAAVAFFLATRPAR